MDSAKLVARTTNAAMLETAPRPLGTCTAAGLSSKQRRAAASARSASARDAANRRVSRLLIVTQSSRSAEKPGPALNVSSGCWSDVSGRVEFEYHSDGSGTVNGLRSRHRRRGVTEPAVAASLSALRTRVARYKTSTSSPAYNGAPERHYSAANERGRRRGSSRPRMEVQRLYLVQSCR